MGLAAFVDHHSLHIDALLALVRATSHTMRPVSCRVRKLGIASFADGPQSIVFAALSQSAVERITVTSRHSTKNGGPRNSGSGKMAAINTWWGSWWE